MRLEYVVITFVIMLIVLIVALTMLGGAKEGLGFLLDWFK